MIDKRIREDFPILQKYKDLIYFDNACTTLKPKAVIDAIVSYYTDFSSCAGRSAHRLSRSLGEKIEESREKIASFVGAKKENIVFTKNCTEALNLIAKTFKFNKKRKVVTTVFEHHSSLLPFLILAKEGKIKLEYVKPLPDCTFDLSDFKEKIDRETALVVVHHANNSMGTFIDVKEIAKIAHDNEALVIIDGAQSVPHTKVNFSNLDIDYLTFSGHKMLGPTGIGVLVSKTEILENHEPFLVGGDTVDEVKENKIIWAKPPRKFEAGIQHYSGIIGLAAACEYLEKIGMENVEKHEKELAKLAVEKMREISNIKIYGTLDYEKRGGIITFNIRGIKPHEVALMLDKLKNIAVRSGFFCAQPALEYLGACEGAVRASFYIYNTKEEIEVFVNTLNDISSMV